MGRDRTKILKLGVSNAIVALVDKIVGDNKFTNDKSSAEESFAWSENGNHDGSRIVTDSVNGSACIEVVASGAGSSGANNIFTNFTGGQLDVNRRYLLRFWAKSVAGDTTLKFAPYTISIQQVMLTGEWKQFELVFTPVSGTSGIVIYLNGAGTFRLDVVEVYKLEEYDLTANGFPLYDLGLLEDESVSLKSEKLADRALSGEEIQTGHDVELNASGLQFDKDEVAELEQVWKSSRTSLFLIGSQEAFEMGRTGLEVIPDLVLDTKGKRLCTVRAKSFVSKLTATNYDHLGVGIDPTSETRAPYRYRTFIEARTRRSHLNLSLIPDVGNFGDPAKLLDESLNRYTATLFNFPTWTHPYLRLDGVNQYGSLGDILNDDGVSDRLFEFWIRVQQSNGTVVSSILSKKNDTASATVGIRIMRESDNTIRFRISDGAQVDVSSIGTVLQNVWNHVAIAVDRNGNATVYLNTVAGVPVSVAATGSALNAIPLYIGRISTFYSQFDLGRVRSFNFGPGGLPASIASIIGAHYQAERSVYGI